MEHQGLSLWDEQDGFFYDVLHTPDGRFQSLKVRSFVGLIPLFAAETLEPELLDQLPAIKGRLQWFIQYRPQLVGNVASLTDSRFHAGQPYVFTAGGQAHTVRYEPAESSSALFGGNSKRGEAAGLRR